MNLCNYTEKHINGYDLIQLAAYNSYATQDSNGHATGNVSIDGHRIKESWVGDKNLDSNYVSEHNLTQ